MKFFKEFKEFITRGNVLDMAVGVIIGGAFSSIVKSLTNSILMPLIGALTGGQDLKSLYVPLWNAELVIVDGVQQLDNYGNPLYSSALYYGEFLQAIIDFLLIALVLFLIIKTFNVIRHKAEIAKEKLLNKNEKKEEEVVAPVVKAPTTEELLSKIVDILETKQEEK